MIQFKETVRIKTYSRAISYILSALETFHRYRTDICPNTIYVTSINDSQHSPESKHYKDEAIDLRSKNFEPWKKSLFIVEFTAYLNLPGTTRYALILEDGNLENEHFHIQVAKGTSFDG